MRSLAFIQVASLGAALEAVNVICNYEKIQLIEMIPMGGPAILFLEGPFDSLNTFRRNLRTADLQKSHMFFYSHRVLDIFYHKENLVPRKEIVVLEAGFVGDLFAAISESLDEIEVMDFTLNRHFSSLGTMILTPKSSASIQRIQLRTEKMSVKMTVFENPSRDLRSLFENISN